MTNASTRRWISRAAFVALAAWAAFWTWFSTAEILGGNEPGAWMHLLFPLAPVLILTALAWVLPRVGGLLLALGGVWAVIFFDSFGGRVFFATPPLLLGALIAVMGLQGPLVGRPGNRQRGWRSAGRR